MKIFSERLKQLREAKMHDQENSDDTVKCTQRFMAKMLGITQQSYCQYEDNYSEPNLTRLTQLADYFDVTTDYLVGKSNDIL